MDDRSPHYFFVFLIIAIPIVAASFVMSIHLQEEYALFSDPTLFLAQVSSPSTSGLVGYWSFDEGSGTTAADASGNGNTGTLINGPTWTTGKINGALSFDGVDDRVAMGSDLIGTGADSISAWIYARSYGGANYGRIEDNGQTYLYVNNSGGAGNNQALRFTSDNVSTSLDSAAGSILLNTWYHVVVTRDSAGTANIYINGAVSGLANWPSGTPIARTTNVQIGGRAGDNLRNFNGLIDEVRVYNRALSATEITDLYNQGISAGISPTPSPTPAPAPTSPSPTPTPTPTPTSNPIDTLNNLKHGEWISIPNSKLRTVLPSPLPQLGYGDETAIMSAWNGAAYDSKRDQLIIAAAGGHADYSGNEVYAFSMSALTWQRLTNPSPTTRFQVDPSTGVNPDGTPVSRHTYDGIEYLPDQDAVWLSGGSRWYDGNGTSEGWWLRLDTSLPQWVRKNNGPTGWLGAQAVWDPISKKLYERGYNRYFSYDPVTDTHAAITSQDAGTGADTMMVVDPERRKIYRIGAYPGYSEGRILVLDLATNIETKQVTTGATKVEFQYNGPGLAWDPVAKVVVAYGKTVNGLNGRIYTLDPTTWVWTARDAVGAVLPPLPNPQGVFGRLWYSPVYDEFFVVTSISDTVYAYRPAWRSSVTPPSDTTSPSTPANLTATAFSSTQINLSWTASTDNVGVASYRIYRSGTQISASNTTSYQNAGLSPATAYSYTVAAADAAGNISAQSNLANATTQTVAVPPPVAGQINLPLGQWVALPSPTPFIDGTKHVSGAWNSDNGRMYFEGGDYGDFGYGSYEQQTWSLSLTERWADKMNPKAGLRLEYDNCGPVGRPRDSGEVQPKHPDFVDWLWDATRHLFWFVPGEMVAGDGNCAGETPQGISDPGFPFYRVMTFNPVSGRWADIAPAEIGGGDQWGAVYDPVTDTIIRFSGYSATKVGTFNIVNRTWSYKAFNSPSFIDRGKPAFDPKTRVIYTISPYSGILYQYNIGTQTFDNLGPIPGGPLTDCWMQPMIIWDAADNVLLFYRHANNNVDCLGNFPNGDFQAYHPDTKKWEQLPVSTDIAGLNVEGLVMDYDHGQNVVTLISRNRSGTPLTGHMFLYRYGAGSVSPPPVLDTTSPTIPTGLTATAVSSSQINLSWTASTDPSTSSGQVSGVAGYRIYRGGTQIATVSGTTYSNTGLSPSTSYSYTIAAYDAAGNVSGQSVSRSITTQTDSIAPSNDTITPTVPQGLTGSAISQSQIALSWTASTDNVGITGYKISRNGNQVAIASSPSYTDTNLLPRTSYTYTVAAYDLAGNTSNQSGSFSFATLAGTPPPPTPPALVFVASPTSVVSGGSTNLVWVSSGTNSCSASGGPAAGGGTSWPETKGISGSETTGALFSNTTYSLTCTGEGGTASQSVTIALTETQPLLDTIAPTISISSPSLGMTMIGVFSIEANVSDNVAVLGLQFTIDSALIGTEIVAPPYTLKWDTHAIANGPHLLSARARDAAGNVAAGPKVPITIFNSNTGPRPTDVPATPPFTSQTLLFGSRDPQVKNLQQFLITQGILAQGNDTGYFGYLTHSAIITLQTRNGIPGTGFVGPLTIQKLNQLQGGGSAPSSSVPATSPTALSGNFTKPLFVGVRDSQVLLLQRVLTKEGFLASINNTGYYGPITLEAVKQFQCRYNIVCNGDPLSTGWGLVGGETRQQLNTLK